MGLHRVTGNYGIYLFIKIYFSFPICIFNRAALTEMSVLLDVLNIAREKRYMVLDPVSQDPPESKTGLYVVAKKKVVFYLEI